ncbi:hypothetical protein XELAEV_18002108mg [Xenopus laevis]|uniref:Uncharacterized protein n=1 Tax=Xenopus laevis TaxID=8355 RepID=A0A974BNX3_XENLA|nr:hypothetical protein XELAEV_18002108mg [Xenopus laevis]
MNPDSTRGSKPTYSLSYIRAISILYQSHYLTSCSDFLSTPDITKGLSLRLDPIRALTPTPSAPHTHTYS